MRLLLEQNQFLPKVELCASKRGMEVARMHALSPEWFFPIFKGLFLGILAMALHEAAHLVTALAVGVKIKKIGFRWKGLYIVREAGTPGKNALVSLAGPLANLLLLLTWVWSPLFGLANLCFTFFNLLPLQGSDGERAWMCWRQMQRESPKAAKAVVFLPRRSEKTVVVAYPASAVRSGPTPSWSEDEYKAS
jgi:Zn-dependent protease